METAQRFKVQKVNIFAVGVTESRQSSEIDEPLFQNSIYIVHCASIEVAEQLVKKALVKNKLEFDTVSGARVTWLTVGVSQIKPLQVNDGDEWLTECGGFLAADPAFDSYFETELT